MNDLRAGRSSHVIDVGFVPLIDASPLIVAFELRYFADEGLDVRLRKQIGWGNVRDRLSYGELHATHAPLGMVPASLAGVNHYEEPLAVLMCLGAGGNAITVSRSLAELEGGTNGPNAPAVWRRHVGRPLNLAYVFSVASHHFALIELLRAAGMDADREAALRVMPPPQMAGLLETRAIDGYCAGEPWNTLAMSRGCGTIVRATTELMPDHPEKVLAVTRRWYDQNPRAAERLVRATLRGCDFCENPANHGRLTEILARPQYLWASDDIESVISRSLSIDTWLRPGVRKTRFRTFARSSTAPTERAVKWVVAHMIRAGLLPGDVDVERIAQRSVIPDAYARAADVGAIEDDLEPQPQQELQTERAALN